MSKKVSSKKTSRRFEQTLIIVKHDGVARGLVGEIMSRFERVGLKLVAMEMLSATDDMGHRHYPSTDAWYKKAGGRTLDEYKQKGIDPIKRLGIDDPIKIGKMIKAWNVEYLTSGPVVAMVWEGPGAVVIGRKLVGKTVPTLSEPGTIRGDFSWDNADLANEYKRPFYNLVHASGEVDEAKEEIELWFDKHEVVNYTSKMHEKMGLYGKLAKKC